MERSTYHVKNGAVLGYIQPCRPGWFNPLSGPVIDAGPVPISSLDALTPATQADFDKFRVCSKGHLS